MLKENIITPKRIKIAIICFVVFAVALIIYVVADNLSRAGKVAVEIKYAPFEASVFIDDQNYAVNNAINYLEPGPHHIMVTMDGFKTLEEDVEITNETKYLYGKLIALNDNDSEVYRDYQTEYGTVEGIGGAESAQSAKSLIETWPILRYLPYISDSYAIGSLFDEQGNLVVTVRAELSQINNAINRLRVFKDVTLSDYNINIIDFTNVLEGKFVENGSSDPIAFLENGYQSLGLPHQIHDGGQVDDYHYAIISVSEPNSHISVFYRVILQKTGASWRLAGTPYPILTTYNTPGVDSRALDAANQQNPPRIVP